MLHKVRQFCRTGYFFQSSIAIPKYGSSVQFKDHVSIREILL